MQDGVLSLNAFACIERLPSESVVTNEADEDRLPASLNRIVGNNLLVGSEDIPLNPSISWNENEQAITFIPDIGERLDWAEANRLLCRGTILERTTNPSGGIS